MPEPEIDRRALLKVAAVGAIWTVPIVYAVTPAAARDLGSRPPKTPPRQVTPPLPGPVPKPDMGPPLPTGIQLAFTGNEERRNVELGVAALAAGYAVTRLAGRRGEPDWSEE